MILRTALVLAALSLFLWNRREGAEAGICRQNPSRVAEQIETLNADDASEEKYAYPDPYDTVMSEWDYTRLKISPCRYADSTRTDDLVLYAHNYTRYFGLIRNLVPGDIVYFTDMDGIVRQYEVVTVDILPPADIKEMTAASLRYLPVPTADKVM